MSRKIKYLLGILIGTLVLIWGFWHQIDATAGAYYVKWIATRDNPAIMVTPSVRILEALPGYSLDEALFTFRNIVVQVPAGFSFRDEGGSYIRWSGESRDKVVTIMDGIALKELWAGLAEDDMVREEFQEMMGQKTLESDYAFKYRIYELTPHDIQFFDSHNEKVFESVLLLFKTITFPTSASSVDVFDTGEIRGFQFPLDQGRMLVEAYDKTGLSYTFIIGGLSREEVDTFLLGIRDHAE